MNRYTKTVNIAFLTRLVLLLLLGNSYAYAQSTTSNVCPSSTVDLTTHVSGTPPVGAVVTWHTGTPATQANQVTNPTKVGAGLYYAAYYDVANQCYGNTTGSLTVTITACAPVNNICPATTVDLTTHVSGTPPTGSVVTWHTSATATAANRIADPTKVGNGLYYAAYFDTSTSCYGNTTSPLTVSIVPCPAAAPDSGTVLAGVGGTAINSVVANDVIGGQPATLGTGGNATIAPVGTYPTGITLNTGTGAVAVATTTPPGTYMVVYQLCNIVSTPTCVTTTATIIVLPNVVAAPDAGTVSSGTGGTAVASVTTNDIVNGQPATLGGAGNAAIALVGTYPAGITLNTNTGSVAVAQGTAPGSYTVAYQLCDKLTVPTCTTGLVAITVTPSVTASPDAGTASSGAGSIAVANVRTNDIVNGVPASAANSVLTVVSTVPGITLNTTTGSVSVAQGTAPGSYTVVYRLCDLLTPATCATTTATITVTPSVTASPDAGTVSTGTGGVATNVRTNDTVNGVPASAANSVLSAVGTYPPGITLSTASGSVGVAQGTTPGTYVLVYQLCDLLTPVTCTTTTATITVTPSVTAAPDAGTVSAGTGGTAVANVRINDIVNGVAASAANSVLSVVSTAPGITLNLTSGAVSVAIGTAPGTYPLIYQLCDLLTPATCTTTTATITVTPSVTASPDAGTVSSGTGGTAVASVTTNDIVNGQPATLGGAGNATVASVGTYPAGITLNTTTGSVSVAQGTAPGSYTVAYQLCDKLTVPTCTTGLVAITVTPSVTASPDAGTVSTGTGGVATNVRTNDTVNGVPASAANSVLSAVGTYPPGITLSTASGSVGVAQGTTPGTYVLVYQLCDLLTPVTCTTTTATITVTSSVTAAPDAGTVSAGTGGTAVANVRINDIVNGVAASAANSVLSVVGTYPAGITLNTTTGSVSVAIGTTPGTYPLVYQLCDRLTPATCTTTTATITVTPSVTVSPDAGTVSSGTGGTAVASVTTNDIVNGQPATLGGAGNATVASVGTYPAGITLNTTTGSVSVAQGTAPGSYTVAYQLCDKLTVPTCTTGLVAITVTPSVTASPDAGTVSTGTGGTAVANVTTNDIVNGQPATLGGAGNATVASVGTYPVGITLNTTTGSVAVAPGTPPGSYTVAYQLCDRLTPATCSTSFVGITVLGPDLIIAIGQPAPILAVGQTSNVPVTVSNIGTSPTSGPVTFTLSIPASVTAPAAFTSNGFSCATSGTLVACTSSATLVNGASTTVLVPITPLPAAAGTSPVISGTAATANETNPNNNTATTTATPAVVAPDLTISIGQPSPVLVVGQTSNVPVTVRNIGTSPTSGPVTFTLSIPASVTAPATFTGNGFGCVTSGTLVTCTSPAALVDGDMTTVLVPITPMSVAVNPVLSATVTTANESNVNNNTATTTISSAVAPDLTVSIGQPSPALVAGQTSTVMITVSNEGTAPTTGPVTFTLSIPASVTAPATFTSNGFSCSTSGTLVACTSPAVIPNGTSTTVPVPVTPLNAAVGTSPVLSVTVATANESNVNNNTAVSTVITPVAGQPDLVIAIGQPSPALVAGQTSNVPVTLNNIGTAPTSGPVAFTLSIPANVTAAAMFSSNGFSCTTSGTLVACSSPASISNGTGITVVVPVTPLTGAAGTSPTLTATVATGNESNPANNTTATTVTVNTNVVASPDSGTASAGTGGAAVANVRANDVVNGAPATAANSVLTVVGTYPAGITLNTTTGSVSVAQGTAPGNYTVAYQLCDLLTPATCATTTATITVTPSVTAAPDAGTVSSGMGGTAVANVRTNDIVNGVAASAANSVLSVVGTYPAGITLNTTTGSVSVAVGTVPGTYPLVYQLCDLLTPATCATTTATITVTPSVTAAPDAGTVSAGTGGTAVANVRTNDVVNGAPATAANSVLSVVGTYPAGITLNTNNGLVNVTVGTAPGTYTLVYQLCDLLTPATCTTTTATITVTPSVTAAPDAGTASAGTGSAAVANVRTNDVVNGAPATAANSVLSVVGTYPAGITLNTTTGSVSVAQGTAPGSYTVVYQLCDLLTPATCATATATITVTPSVTAAPDAGTVSSGTGGTAVANVRANDVVNGIPASAANSVLTVVGTYPAGITLNTTTGSVSVAVGTAPGTYPLVYQLCDLLTPATCTTTTATITVTPSVTAAPDAGTVSAGTGGTAVANVRTNDVVNGAPATVANSVLSVVGTYPAGITLNTNNGLVNVAAGTAPGTYTLVYQLCDRLTPATCTTTTATITVTPSVTAAPDAGTASAGTGGAAVANVRANDVVNGVVASAANSVLTVVGTYPTGITLNTTTGSVSVAVGTAPGSYTVAYQLCDLLTPATCATATATITVAPSVTAAPDAGTVSSGTSGTAVANVRVNDVVNGIAASAANSVLTVVSTAPGITLNTATGSVSVAQGTMPGTYPLVYQLCDLLTPATCTTTTATITVTPSVTAAPDAGTVSAGTGGTAVANVRANDVVNGIPASAANSVLSVVSTAPGISLNTTAGSINVAVGTAPGTYTLVYQLCDMLAPATCTTTTATITVTPSVTAAPDAGTASAGTDGVAVANVRANDVVNGVAASAANSVLSVVGTYPAGITLNTTTGSVSVAVGTVPGTYPLVYQLCDLLTPATCTTTTATITVTPSVTATPDAGTVSAGTGGTAVANVRTNDTVNGIPASAANSVLTVVSTAPGITLNTTTGSVSVAQGTMPGTYPLVYQLCDLLTPATCTTTTATITVTPSVTAAPDAGMVSAGMSGTAVANVTTNDIVNGQPATLGGAGNATIASVGIYPAGITLNTTTGSVSVAQGTMPGSYTVTYQLCDKLTPNTCSTAIVTISVTAGSMATPDAGTVSAGTGGTAVADVTANDVVNGQPATLGGAGNATVASVGTYPAGITLNTTTGSVSVAQGTAPGSYTVAYQLCDRLAIPTCTTGLVTITISPSVTATPDAGTASAGTGGTAVANVTVNDLVNGLPATLGAGGNATVADIGIYPAGITLNTATGAISVAPGTVPGSYTVAYQLCDKLTPTTCATTTLVVTVTSSLTANADNAAVAGGASVTIPILANDKNPDGSPVTDLTRVTLPLVSTLTKGQVVVNPDGSLSYSANIGSSGSEVLVYSICDRANPTQCSSATVTIAISPNLSVVLSPKVYLQGALFGVPAGNPLMRDDLRAKGYVPLTSPYVAQGMIGLTPVGATTSAVLSVTGSQAVVDWVFVELRSPSSNTVVVDSRPALVLRSGDIVEVDGVSSLSFSAAQNGSYFVVVRHRNHLGVMTAQSVPLSFSSTVVDFRQSTTLTYNLDQSKVINQPRVVVNQGVALWAGNALVDKEVIYQGAANDVNVISQQVINASGNVFVNPSYKLRGYYTGDINLNGEVIFQGTGNDVDFIYQNIIKNHPGNTLRQNFFKIREQLP